MYSGAFCDLQFVFEKKKIVQRSILSSFLFNVFINELDEKIASLQRSIYKTRKICVNEVCRNKSSRKNRCKVNFNFRTTNLKKVSKKTSTQIKEFIYKKSYSKNMGSETKHIQHVRHVDDFLIGIAGSREFALQIRKYLNNFIRSNLHLKIKKDHLTSCHNKQVEFLGHFVSFSKYKKEKNITRKRIYAFMKNRSILKLSKKDKRITKVTSNQFYFNILKQFEIPLNQPKMSIIDESNAESSARLIAYKSLSFQFSKFLCSDNREPLNELLSLVNFNKLFLEEKNNPFSSCWSSYLQTEHCSTDSLSTSVLYNKIVLWITSRRYENIFKEQIGKPKYFQKDYLIKIEKNMKESLKLGTEKTPNKFISKFKTNISTKVLRYEKDNDFPNPAKKIINFIPENSFSKRISINAPVDQIFVKLRLLGYIDSLKNESTNNFHLNFCTDFEIVSHFNLVIRGLLNWHSDAGNFGKVKGLAQLLRFSCVLTLANKHKKSKNWVYIVYGNEIDVLNGKKRTSLTSKSSILNYFNGFDLKMNCFCTDYYDSDEMIGRFNK